MKYELSERDMARLNTCHRDLKRVFILAPFRIPYPMMIVWGFRNEMQQNSAAAQGHSEKRWPDSLHNNMNPDGDPESLAVDFAPIFNGVIPWNDSHIFAAVYGGIAGAARELAIPLRWGGDWNGDGSTRDQKLMDWGHVELTRR